MWTYIYELIIIIFFVAIALTPLYLIFSKDLKNYIEGIDKPAKTSEHDYSWLNEHASKKKKHTDTPPS